MNAYSKDLRLRVLDAVDRGQVRLDDKVTLGRSDLTLFHQPLAQKILGGGHTTTLGALMFTAITSSDNTANDKLMRSVGGPQAVRSLILNKGLGAIRFYDGERALQSKIAGLIWTPSYSIGNAFYSARNALPMSLRKAAFDRYREAADGCGYEVSPKQLAAAVPTYVSSTDEAAHREARPHVEWLFQTGLKIPPYHWFPPGYMSQASFAEMLEAKTEHAMKDHSELTYDELTSLDIEAVHEPTPPEVAEPVGDQ